MSDLFPSPGDLFEERYRVGPLIGSGGFARVYKARQEDLGRDVALKILTPSGLGDGEQYDENLANRFIQEARLVSRLRDPHTITMYDYGQTDEGLLYMVFEYINGFSLSALIKREGAIAPGRVVKILQQTLSSLEEAHAHEYLHRDIKPGNIMVFEHVGRADQVKLLDFGIAKVTDSQSTLKGDLTADGALIGTPRYMSPEQIRGHKMNPQSDIYSLGLVAFELVMGRKAIESNSSVTIIGQQLDPEPFEIPEMPGCPAGLRHIINRMLAKDRDARYETAREVLDALESWRSPEGVFDIDVSDSRSESESDPDLVATARIEDPSAELEDHNTRQIARETGKQQAISREPETEHVPAPVAERANSSSQELAAVGGGSATSTAPALTQTPSRQSMGSQPLMAQSSASAPAATNSSRFEPAVYKGPRSTPDTGDSKTKYIIGGILLLVLLLGAMGVFSVLQDDGGDAAEVADVEKTTAVKPTPAPEATAEPSELSKKVAVSRRMLIRTTPTARKVWLNGRPMGQTPVTVEEANIRFPAKVRVQVGEGKDHVVDVAGFDSDVHVDVSGMIVAQNDATAEEPRDEAVETPRPATDKDPAVAKPKQKPKPKPRVEPKPKPEPRPEPKPEPKKDPKDESLTLPALDY